MGSDAVALNFLKELTNFESSTWTVEIIRTRSPCPGWFSEISFKKNLKYERSMGSDAIAVNF